MFLAAMLSEVYWVAWGSEDIIQYYYVCICKWKIALTALTQ